MAALKYARESGFLECVLVSGDRGHSEAAVKQLGAEYGIDCRLISNTDLLVEMMENLAAARVKSLIDAVVNETSAFMEGHRESIQKFLEEHPLKMGDFFPLPSPLFTPPAEVVSLSLGPLAATPSRAPREGEDCPITFYVNVVGEFVIEEFELLPPPIAHVDVRPGEKLRPIAEEGTLASIFGPPPPMGLPVRKRTNRSVEVSLVGRTVARFEGNRFVGEPRIESLQVGKK